MSLQLRDRKMSPKITSQKFSILGPSSP